MRFVFQDNGAKLFTLQPTEAIIKLLKFKGKVYSHISYPESFHCQVSNHFFLNRNNNLYIWSNISEKNKNTTAAVKKRAICGKYQGDWGQLKSWRIIIPWSQSIYHGL